MNWGLELPEKEWRAKQRSLLGHCVNEWFSCILNTVWSSDSSISNWILQNHKRVKECKKWLEGWKKVSKGRKIKWEGGVRDKWDAVKASRSYEGIREGKLFGCPHTEWRLPFIEWLVLHTTCSWIVELLATGFLGDKKLNRKQKPEGKQKSYWTGQGGKKNILWGILNKLPLLGPEDYFGVSYYVSALSSYSSLCIHYWSCWAKRVFALIEL